MGKRKEWLGMVYTILAATFFGTMPLFTKIAYQYGSNAFSVAFGRFFFGAVILYLIIRYVQKDSIQLTRKQFIEILGISIFSGATPVLLYYSYSYIDTGLASTLHFTYPVAVIVILALFFRNRLTGIQILCTILCLGGMAMLYKPGGAIDLRGIFIALASGITFGIYIVLLGKSSVKKLTGLVVPFWVALLSAVEIFVVAVISGQFVWKKPIQAWGAEVLLAVAATVLGLVLFQKGVALCGEIKSSLLSTFEPLTGIVIGIFVFNEVLLPKEIVGVAAILLATVLLVLPKKAAA